VNAAPRTLIFALCFALAVSGTLLSMFEAVQRPNQERPKLALDAIPLVNEQLAQISSQAERAGSPILQVVMIGDSMLFARRDLGAVPLHIERKINRASPDGLQVAVRPLAIAGSASFDYYFVVDEVTRRKPDLVVIEFNLTTLSEIWRNVFARPQLAGLISPRRVPEALGLPLYWTGLTADRVLLYVALVHLGVVDAWTQLELNQTRASNLPDRLARRVAAFAGTSAEERFNGLRFIRNLRKRPGTERFDAAREQERFGAALAGVAPDHPVLRALAATVRNLQDAGVRVYVYVNPVNVDNLEEIGILDRESLDATLSSLERVVEDAGARYSDFHDLLPDAGFMDAAGHFSHGGTVDGTDVVARAIAKVVVQEAAALNFRR
jgi:hypothetical protein